jgi:hypothetical protein
MDFSNVVAEDIDGDGDKDDISLDGASPRSLPPIWAEVSVWFLNFFAGPHQFLIIRILLHKTHVAGDAVPDQSSQADDLGAVKA